MANLCNPRLRSSSRSNTTLSNTFPNVALNNEVLLTKKNSDVLVDSTNSSLTDSAKRRAAQKKKAIITANLAGTRYDVVRTAAEKVGLTVSKEDDMNAYLVWMDSVVTADRCAELKNYQRINHFPGMGEISRKDALARNMARMAKLHPDEYDFVPRSWNLPAEYAAFQSYAKDLKKKRKTKTFIVKPPNGAMGNGISLFRCTERVPANEPLIVQEYIDKPFLLDGYKFDLRIYVLVTSCDPLKIFIYNDGLVRMATEKYSAPTDANVDTLYMHLTNYSVNKRSENYEKSGDVTTGSKRSLRYLVDYLRRIDFDVQQLWRSISELIIKTLIVAEPSLLHAYRMCRPGNAGTASSASDAACADSVCFEVLGFDVLIDRKLKPWLIEINRSPSFGTDESLDHDVKFGVLHDAFRLLNIRASDKRKKMAAQKAETQKRLLRPRGNDDRRQSTLRRKEELKSMLAKVRREADREDFENRNSGNFKRIFPPDDRFSQEKYARLLKSAFSAFLTSRGDSLQKEVDRVYMSRIKEEELLDQLAQCEADETRIGSAAKARSNGPKFDHAGSFTAATTDVSPHQYYRQPTVYELLRSMYDTGDHLTSLPPLVPRPNPSQR